jgi:hypothetical protein
MQTGSRKDPPLLVVVLACVIFFLACACLGYLTSGYPGLSQ